MQEETTAKSKSFSDHLFVLYKWKKFLFINLFVGIIIFAGITLLMPDEFKATASVIIPPENSMAGFGGLLGGGKSSASSIGSKLLGISSTSEDVLLGILNSRTAITEVINRFNLMDYYEIKNKNIDKAIKAFRGDLTFETNEFGIIDINVVNKNPELSSKIANFFAVLVDSLNIKLNTTAAKNNRIFVEQRYIQNIKDLQEMEDSMYRFQKKYGIVAVPEQLEAAVKSSAELEAQLMQVQLQKELSRNQVGENSPQYQVLEKQLDFLKGRVMELKKSENPITESNILFPFKKMPNIYIEYFRILRSIEIQGKLMEFILPMYEQSKVEENKSIPTVIVIDKATIPQLKYAPRRSLIVLGLSFALLFFIILVSYWGDNALTRTVNNNDYEVKEAKFFKRIVKFYKLK